MSTLKVNAIQSNTTQSINVNSNLGNISNIEVSGVGTFSGGVVISSGSTSAPSISPTGDSNTGIFFPSPDTIAFAEGGVEALRIDSSANIGIGTTGGNARLVISVPRSSSTNATAIILRDNVTGAQTDGVYKAIRSESNNGNSISEIRFVETDGTNNNTAISFATAATAGGLTERLRVHRDGNIGINSTSPARKLDVVDSGANGSVIRSRVTTNNGGYLAYEALNSSGTSVFSVTHNGRINLSENIVFASGQGLDFSATANSSGTMTSEVLADYEEGFWTPTLSNFSGTPSYQYQEGFYTKIGRYVIAQGIMGVTNSNTLGSGAIRISLPFTASATGSYGFCGPVADGSGFPTASFPQFGTMVAPNNSYGSFVTIDTSALTISYNQPSATWYVRFNFMYLA